MAANLTVGARAVGTSDIVVPFSEIVDRLGALIGPDQLNDVLRDIIARRRREVRPGELITAELMNQILGQLESLELRVAALESQPTGGGEPVPIISDWSPKPVAVRQRLDVTGLNFPATPSATSVDLDGNFVTHFISANATSMSFEVPPGIQSVPRDVPLTIRNGQRSATVQVSVKPEAVIPKGTMFVNDVTPSLGLIETGKTYTFVFELDSQTIPSEQYQVGVLYSDAVGTATAQTWKQNTTLRLANNAALPSEVTVGPESKVTVKAEVTIPAGATSVNFALRAVSVNNPAELTKTSKLIGIKVGDTQVPSDPHTTFSINIFGPLANARKTQIDGIDGIEVVYNKSELLKVTAHFTADGTYEHTVEMEAPDPNIWALTFAPKTTAEVSGGEEVISFTLGLKKTTADPSGAHLEKKFMVVRSKRTNADGTGQFTSFTRFPVQGFTKA
jgi:hypothetical protein